MAAKARRELLLPRGRRTDADRAGSLKHEPLEEFRDSVYRDRNPRAPTLLALPAPAFKGAMSTAALDLPGTKKSEIGRLTWVTGTYIHIYGIPELMVSVVRCQDINKTPDIRTRAIIREWCCTIEVNFIQPKLKPISMFNLLAASGLICGVGDFRQEKGKGSFGQFKLCDNANDADFKRIVKEGGRQVQIAEMENPRYFDDEAEEIVSWFHNEVGKYRSEAERKLAAKTAKAAERETANAEKAGNGRGRRTDA